MMSQDISRDPRGRQGDAMPRVIFATVAAVLWAAAIGMPVAQAQVPPGYPSDYGKVVDAAKNEGRLVVYSTTDAAAANALLRDFATLYPGVKVDYTDMNSTEL